MFCVDFSVDIWSLLNIVCFTNEHALSKGSVLKLKLRKIGLCEKFPLDVTNDSDRPSFHSSHRFIHETLNPHKFTFLAICLL